MENNVEEGGSNKGLLFSEVFMVLIVFIKLYFRNKMEDECSESSRIDSLPHREL